VYFVQWQESCRCLCAFVHFSGVAEYFYSGDGGFSAETVATDSWIPFLY
jgi:hypothetical protein